MPNITILQSPASYTPAYNDNVFVVTSSNKSQANFRYIADIIVNGQSFRQSVFPHPTYQTGIFNISRVVENYISNSLSTSTYGFQENVGQILNYTVQFGEEYGLASSGTTVYPNQASSSKYVWNGVIDFLPFSNYSYTTYVSGASAANILTNAPSSGVIRDNENAWLSVLNESSGTIFYANVKTYDISNNLLQTIKVANPYQALTSNNSRFVRFGSGTYNLNQIPSSGIISGAQPIITASVYKYSITFETFAGTAKSNTYWYLVDNACTRNNTYRFHFLNKLGGWDSFTFIRTDKKTSQITRSSYKRNYNDMLTSTTYGYTAKDATQVDYDIRMNETYIVKSDWIKENTSNWLYELITSPQVYVDDATYGLVAVNIINTAYDFKRDAQDKLISLELQFKYSFDTYRQRR